MNSCNEKSYTLMNGVLQNHKNPNTFFIPCEHLRNNLKPGTHVKLVFCSKKDNSFSERMWVLVTKKTDTGYIGTLANDPFIVDELKFNNEIEFSSEHVISILN